MKELTSDIYKGFGTPGKAPSELNIKILKNIILRNPPSVNLPHLINLYAKYTRTPIKNHKNKHALRMQITRKIQAWERQGYVKMFKDTGFIYVVALEKLLQIAIQKANSPRAGVDLMKGVANFKPLYTSPGGFTTFQNPLKSHNSHEISQQISERPGKMKHRSWEESAFLLGYKALNKVGWRILNEKFQEYKADVARKKLVFQHPVDGTYKIMDYTHRFLEEFLQDKIAQYNAVWEQEEARYGVFLTTTFPAEKPLAYYNNKTGKFYNALMSWVQKQVGYRPHYLRVHEFQDNGRVHLHIIFFGIRRLADKKTELTPELEALGFGPINFIYQIKKTRGKWRWARSRPEDCNTQNVKSHFKKYLEKALTGEEAHPKIAMYWLSCKNFFTCSRCYELKEETYKDRMEEVVGWLFLGVYHVDNIPDFIFNNAESPMVATIPPP